MCRLGAVLRMWHPWRPSFSAVSLLGPGCMYVDPQDPVLRIRRRRQYNPLIDSSSSWPSTPSYVCMCRSSCVPLIYAHYLLGFYSVVDNILSRSCRGRERRDSLSVNPSSNAIPVRPQGFNIQRFVPSTPPTNLLLKSAGGCGYFCRTSALRYLQMVSIRCTRAVWFGVNYCS